MTFHCGKSIYVKKKNVQPSDNDKTSLGKVLFPPRNYRTEAPVEVLDTPSMLTERLRPSSSLQITALTVDTFDRAFPPSFSSLNLELLKSSQTVEVDKEQKQTKNPTKPKQPQVKSETKQNIQCNGK